FLLVSRLFSIRPGYLQSRDSSLDLPISTDAARLNDGDWHHLAFTFTALERQMRHFVDGRLQPLPEKGTFLPQMGQIVSMRFGAGMPDLAGIWDEGDRLGMLYTNGGMWGGKPHAVCLATSRDGIHWTKPDLGVVSWDGSLANNIVLRNASQGMAFHDPNPATP